VQRTSIPVLIGLTLIGAALGWLSQMSLAAAGAPSLVPPVTLVVALVGIAAIVVVLGWPIRQVVRGKRKRRVDPFFAMRVLVFAKASSLTGALLTGAAAGLVVFALTRSALPLLPGVWADVFTLLAALALVIAGLVVENWCRIPPDDREQAPSRALEHR
jgi:hypothetical protein